MSDNLEQPHALPQLKFCATYGSGDVAVIITPAMYEAISRENAQLRDELKVYKDAQKQPLAQSESVALKWMNEALNLRAKLARAEKEGLA